MSARLMLALTVGLMLSGAASNGDEGKKEPQKFQGKVRWSFNAGETVTGQLVVKGQVCLASVSGKHNGGIPGAGQGKVIALDKDSGKLLWEFKDQSAQLGPCVTWKDSVIFGAKGVLYALDLSSGKVRWKTEIEGYLGSSAGIAVSGDNIAIIASTSFQDGGSLCLVDCEKGKILWKKKGPFKTVAADERLLYLGSRDKLTPKETPPMVMACLAKDGKEVWVFDSYKGFLAEFRQFALDPEHLYTATYSDGTGEFASTQYLYALKKADGKVAWKVEQKKSNRKGPYVLADKVYVTDWSGTSMSVNAKTGEVFAKRFFTDDSFPIADGVTLDIATAYDIKAGDRLWAAKPLPAGNSLQNSHMATPTVHGGRIYTDHHTGHVICIE